MPRKPKDITKYLTNRIAAARLINCTLQHVLFAKDSIKVKWSLSVHYWQEDRPDGQKVIISAASFSSGNTDGSDT